MGRVDHGRQGFHQLWGSWVRPSITSKVGHLYRAQLIAVLKEATISHKGAGENKVWLFDELSHEVSDRLSVRCASKNLHEYLYLILYILDPGLHNTASRGTVHSFPCIRGRASIWWLCHARGIEYCQQVVLNIHLDCHVTDIITAAACYWT